MNKLISLLILVAFFATACENAQTENVDDTQNSQDSLITEEKNDEAVDILAPQNRGTLKIEEKMAVIITPDANWQTEKSYELKDNYSAYLDSIKSSYRVALDFLEEKSIPIVNANDKFNLFIESDTITVDLRVGLIAKDGYGLVLVNPGVDFDIVLPKNIEKVYSEIFEK